MASKSPKTYIIALGGNALTAPGDRGTAEEMAQRIRNALKGILSVLKPDDRLVLTHGNGPQVGNELLRYDAGKQIYGVESFPLDMAVASTQGYIGYLLEREWRNLLLEQGREPKAASLVSLIEVSPSDPAFERPAKRVGKTYYDRDEVKKLIREKNWRFTEEIKQNKKGWRRVVPSPQPLKVLNAGALKTLLEAGFMLVAGGGGGIPVINHGGQWQGVEAVIDKDAATALLAETLNADEFIVLTDVDYVYENYGTPAQKPLEVLNINQIEEYIARGVFGEGNMLPKIKAAVSFVRRTGHKALITGLDGLQVRKGTWVVS